MRDVDSTNGGWAEQEDRDLRDSDSLNGGDGSYDRTWRDRLENDNLGFDGQAEQSKGGVGNSGGGSSSINGAINNVRNSLAANRNNTLTNNTLASGAQGLGEYQHSFDDVQAKSWRDTLNNIKAASKPVIDNMDKVVDAPNIAMQNQSQKDFAQRALDRAGYNALGGLVSDAINSNVKVDKLGTAFGLSVGGIAAGKSGDMLANYQANKSRESLSLDDKMAYDMHTNRLQDQFDAQYNSPGREMARNVVSGIGTVASLASGGYMAPAAAFANTALGLHHTVSSLKDMAKEHGLTAMQQSLDERDVRMAREAREREANRGKYGSDNVIQSKGILDAMHQRASNGSYDVGRSYNAIPTLSNLWKNVYIK